MVVPGEGEKEKGTEKVIEKIMAKDFLNLMKILIYVCVKKLNRLQTQASTSQAMVSLATQFPKIGF